MNEVADRNRVDHRLGELTEENAMEVRSRDFVEERRKMERTGDANAVDKLRRPGRPCERWSDNITKFIVSHARCRSDLGGRGAVAHRPESMRGRLRQGRMDG